MTKSPGSTGVLEQSETVARLEGRRAAHDATTGRNAETRLAWLDTARGFGIVLVVAGHAWSSGTGHRLIYAFHMPFFFLVSGLLYRPGPPIALMRRRFQAYLPPYLTYLLLLGPVFKSYEILRQSGWHLTLDAVGRVLFDLAYGGTRLKGALTVMWFLPCFLFVQVVYGFLVAAFPARRSIGLALLVTVLHLAGLALCAYYAESWANPLDILAVPVALLFFWAGHVAAPWLLGAAERLKLVAAAAMSGAIGVAALWLYPGLIETDIKVGLASPPLLAALLAIALSILLLEVARAAARLPRLEAIAGEFGRASLTIMFVHPPVLYLAAMVNGTFPDTVPPALALAVALANGMAVYRLSATRPLLAWCFNGTPPGRKISL